MLLYVFVFIFVRTSNTVFVNFCLTSQCQRTANNIVNSLNKSASICNDFYEYSCGGFIKNTQKPPHQPIWNYWQSITDEMQMKLVALLNINEDMKKSSFKKAQLMFNTCLMMERNEQENVKHLRHLIDGLINGGGDSPLLKRDQWNEGGFDWMQLCVNVIKSVGVYPILKIFPEVDFNDTTRRIIYIQLGDINLPHSVLTNPSVHLEKINLYKRWIYNSIESLYTFTARQKNHSVTEINDVLNFEISLAKLIKRQDNKNKRISLRKLTQITQINWLQILRQLFSETNTTFNDNQQVIITSFNTFKKLILLLNTTKPNIIGTNYITWTIIKTFSRDTTNHLRKLNFLMEKTFFDLKSDQTVMDECIAHVKSNFGLALVGNYANLFMHPDTIATVARMVQKIKSEFIVMLNANDWLSIETKRAAVEKIVGLDSLVGYPKWVENGTLVDEYYKEFDVVENHLLNVLRARQFQIRKELLKIEKNDKNQWPVNPFEVNAFYSVLKNTIVIPVGIMEAPFFDTNRPEVFNYGSLGSLIGHEISHALDTTGRKFDKNGQLKKWWSKNDIQIYENKSKCFELQYNNYAIDGIQTLGENIADNVGLKISYNAFKTTTESRFPVVIPKLDFYSNEQWFFLSFAQLWCEISGVDQFLIEGEEHSPVRERVLGTVSNSIEFDKAFQCYKPNKNTTCNLW